MSDPQDIPAVKEGAIENGAADYTDWLDGTELLSGTPTVVEVDTADLTISQVERNTATVEVKGRTVAIDKAVKFRVAGQLTGKLYKLKITVDSDDGRKHIAEPKIEGV